VAIDPSGNAELKAQIALRYAFWKKAQGQFEAGYMPSIDTSARAWLTSARGGLESKRTAFWVDTLLLSDMIRPDSAWSKDAAKATAQYLSRYSDKTAEPYRTSLENQAKARVSAAIREATDKAAWTETVAIWEGLTGSLRSIGEAAPISWAMAESYRQMGHHDKASEFYRRAAKGFETAPERFRASFWESVTASTAAESRQDLRGRDAEFTSWDDHARLADQQTLAQWNTLEPSQKTEMYAVLREPLEKQATGLALLKAPPQIVLEMWSGALNTETSVVGGEPSSATSKGFQGPRSVTLLTELRSKLEKIGMHDQAKAARDLLKKLDAKELAADKAARRVWGEEISALAEEERQASNYLEAGKLYGVVGSEGVAAEGKASALYKSGLLLYRAGRRQEAIEALRKASEDQNDLHYAELAKQRLSQLEK
jgi:tetratricopeptide (TPR) repeat protein